MTGRRSGRGATSASGAIGQEPEVCSARFLGHQLAAAQLGDRRLTSRLERIVGSMAEQPEASFPDAMGDAAALEATYRFLGNERVTAEAILQPHIRSTVEQAAAHKTIVVAHDTTQFNFGAGPRNGLGRVGVGKAYGFFAHLALAVTADGQRLPLGALGMVTWVRPAERKPHLKHGRNQDNPANEALRWRKLVRLCHQRLEQRACAIHVMDREADDYALMAQMTQDQCRFVVRQGQKRSLLHAGERRLVRQAAGALEFVAQRDVPLSTRRRSDMPTYRNRFPERQARVATLSIRALTLTIPRPETASQSPSASLTLQLVHVLERHPPEGLDPVQWWLWTSEPTDTPEQILAVVDFYRARWVIEEFFKALKTGCAYEARQLESQHALLNALAVFVPVAWRLLLLRNLARDDAHQNPLRPLSPVQLRCLRVLYKKRTRKELSAAPKAADLLLAIAALGGHLKHNGSPGWQVLWRGFRKLLDWTDGFQAASQTNDVTNP